MEFQGTVIKILPEKRGTSARGEWQRQEVIFEIMDGSQYSRKAAVNFMNKPMEVQALHVGTTYNVSFNIESREYNERWYTDIRAWRVTPVVADAQPEAAATGYSAPQPSAASYSAPQPTSAASSADEVDDLPF
ncbi:MAG: DUF3127 domain-containing protein [Rikenellaceae bacterium]